MSADDSAQAGRPEVEALVSALGFEPTANVTGVDADGADDRQARFRERRPSAQGVSVEDRPDPSDLDASDLDADGAARRESSGNGSTDYRNLAYGNGKSSSSASSAASGRSSNGRSNADDATGSSAVPGSGPGSRTRKGPRGGRSGGLSAISRNVTLAGARDAGAGSSSADGQSAGVSSGGLDSFHGAGSTDAGSSPDGASNGTGPGAIAVDNAAAGGPSLGSSSRGDRTPSASSSSGGWKGSAGSGAVSAAVANAAAVAKQMADGDGAGVESPTRSRSRGRIDASKSSGATELAPPGFTPPGPLVEPLLPPPPPLAPAYSGPVSPGPASSRPNLWSRSGGADATQQFPLDGQVASDRDQTADFDATQSLSTTSPSASSATPAPPAPTTAISRSEAAGGVGAASRPPLVESSPWANHHPIVADSSSALPLPPPPLAPAPEMATDVSEAVMQAPLPPPPVVGDALGGAAIGAGVGLTAARSNLNTGAALDMGRDLAARVPQLVEQGLRNRSKVRARKVRRVVRHVDPWSVLTFSVVFHLCVFASMLLASVLVWNAAVAAGTISNIENFIRELGDYTTFKIHGDVVFKAAMIIAGILTLASSIMVVLLAVVFNLISDLVGGIRITVVEEESVRVRRKENQ